MGVSFLIWVAITFTVSLFFLPQISSSLSPSAISLLSFRNSLPKPSQLLLPWNQSDPSSPCSWTGVFCSGAGELSLNFSGIGLAGDLNPSVPHLCGIKGLVSLDLSSNQFSGPIPLSFINCTRVHTLFLNDNILNGSIPREIFGLKHLVTLDLGFNLLAGGIPPEVRLCTHLEYLGFYNNYLSGEIPKELFFLPNLQFLYLNTNNLTGALLGFAPSCAITDLWVHQNKLSGSLPLSLSHCNHLVTFYASENGFRGRIPEIFGDFPWLEVLSLSDNNFIGEMPRSFGNYSNLSELDLSGNDLNGIIPELIGRYSELTTISLSRNHLVGDIPPSIGNLRNLTHLLLFDNELRGRLPAELGNCTSLVELRLQNNFIERSVPLELCKLENLVVLLVFNNRLSGNIPREIGRMRSLAQLALYNNSFSGQIPEEISQLRNLRYLSFAYNSLSGKVPFDLGRDMLSGLEVLDLTGNYLYGSIPSGLCEAGKLSILDLGKNRFNGSIPAEIGQCGSLTRVILSDNLLQGSLPSNFNKSSRISYLDLSGNLLEGTIPWELSLLSNLSMLDISDNRLSGSIPPELGKLRNLQKLQISSNRLIGSIPPELGNCEKLIKLDLNKNRLSGSIPSQVLTLEQLQSVLLQENELTGSIPNSFSSLMSLIELNLGGNKLDGNVPVSLGNLPQFSMDLNLSNNQMSGEIPPSLGNLDKLQSLDLSNNRFSGKIPAQLNNMLSLSYVNISNNMLSGSLPLIWMTLLASYPSSFLGNPELSIDNTRGQHTHVGRKRVLSAVLVGSIFSVVVLCLVLYLLVVRKVQRRWSPLEYMVHDDSAEDLPQDLKFEDIMRVTEGLNEKYVIGRGCHGTVYRAELASGKLWAVKKLDLAKVGFVQEMNTLNMARHRNLVRMAGYCIKGRFGLIVYEYIQGGTLFEVLHREKAHVVLDWNVRYRIALGIAQGLSYLHHDCVPQIIHRDVKSSNILMDLELEPKIGDFGTAKLVNGSDTSSTISSVIGTLGYIAPEYGYSTRLNEKCDVYSYGVILLELLSRKMPVDPSFPDNLDIVAWTVKHLERADESCPFYFLDEEISFWLESEKSKAVELLKLAVACTQLAYDARPSMRDVIGCLLKLNG